MKPTYEQLEVLIAMKDEALSKASELFTRRGFNEAATEMEKALSTSTESIAAWEADKLLPLKRQVAMLRSLLDKLEYNEFGAKRYPDEDDVNNALSNTQATAEAYDREHAAKVRSVALEDVGAMIAVGATINELSDYVLKELRAANKKENE